MICRYETGPVVRVHVERADAGRDVRLVEREPHLPDRGEESRWTPSTRDQDGVLCYPPVDYGAHVPVRQAQRLGEIVVLDIERGGDDGVEDVGEGGPVEAGHEMLW